jgi:hypothetical protein
MGMDWPHTEETTNTASPDRPSNGTHKAKEADDDLGNTWRRDTESEL